MAKVVLTMQYDVDEEKRQDYLSTVAELKAHYTQNPHVHYSVYEQKGKRNAFAEMFVAQSEEAFKQYEESDDEVADNLAQKLAEFFKGGKAKYSTFVEA
jgi:phytoene dehydrogenase-like protein